MVAEVFLGLGSNLGDRLANIRLGVEGLAALTADGKVEMSSIFETEPWGVAGQNSFLNAAATISTLLEPNDLLRRLKDIEVLAGRNTLPARWQPRSLDIDILLFGDRIIRHRDLQIPHSLLLERRFVLTPLAQLAGERIIPGCGLTVSQALASCIDEHWLRPYSEGIRE